jgi:hypothetical protein
MGNFEQHLNFTADLKIYANDFLGTFLCLRLYQKKCCLWHPKLICVQNNVDLFIQKPWRLGFR